VALFSVLLLDCSVSIFQSLLSNADFLLSVWNFLWWFSSRFHISCFLWHSFSQILLLWDSRNRFFFLIWFLSYYFKKECKRSKGRNEIESNIRITFSSVYFFNSSTNIESSTLNLSTSILSVSHNRSMNKYFLLNISDSKHCILFSVRSCLVIGSLFVSISNWFNKSTSFL